MAGFLIRVACDEDAGAIVACVREHARESGASSDLDTAYVRRYLASGHGAILMAERDGSVLGLLSYSIRPDLYHAANVCLLEELIVARSARRQGVGRARMAELMRRAARNACVEIAAAVDRGNPEALAFYRAQGLTEEAVLAERHVPDSGDPPAR